MKIKNSDKAFSPPLRRAQTLAEETVNALLHGTGALFASAALVLLVLRASGLLGGTLHGIKALAACTIYASTLIVLFVASTLYHAVSNQKVKRVLRVFDHSAIYLLIAGTYTPISLILLPPTLGWTLSALEWALALAGIILHSLDFKFLKKIEIVLYMLMGWALVLGGPVIIRSIEKSSLILLLSGGLAFSAGVFFYKKHQKRFFHAIWHIFVLAGTALQWAAVYKIV